MRIVAGEMRGRLIIYNGDPSIRPMKDRTRESVFNLIGGDLSGMIAIDLFAGTGALGLESVSRGAVRAILLELNRAAIGTIIENTGTLGIADRVEIHNVDTLRWFKYLDTTTKAWQGHPWVVFCCPPYRMWHSELEKIREGLLTLLQLSPPGSLFVAETEQDFDLAQTLPEFDWDIREYKPAYVGVAEKTTAEPTDSSADNPDSESLD
ncbi:MAG: RsmD family RNA methyltransferase [Pirellulales bacterium]